MSVENIEENAFLMSVSKHTNILQQGCSYIEGVCQIKALVFHL